MSGIPVRSYFFTSLLVLVTAWAYGVAWDRASFSWTERDVTVAAILFVMIVLAEILDINIPHPVITFTLSVTAALALACGLQLGPFGGGMIAMAGVLVEGLYARRAAIKTVVNVANYGLATVAAGGAYLALADNSITPLATVSNIVALVVSGVVFTFINLSSLVLIVAPVVGTSPLALWRANYGGTAIELVALPMLGGLVPVLAAQNPFAILVLLVPLVGPHLAFKGFQRAQDETRVTMESLADALERRDEYTHNHSVRVADYVAGILREMPQVPFETAEAIRAAARVHDLGKVGIRDAPLTKAGPLTPEERDEIQQHPTIGADIIEGLKVYRRGVDMVRHHHERWDGKGYPSGLTGEDIPLGARIIAVADTFDAMTSDRAYRRALDRETALAEIRRHIGTQFDPQVVSAFERSMAEQAGNLSRPLDYAEPTVATSSSAPQRDAAAMAARGVESRPMPAVAAGLGRPVTGRE